MCQISQHGDKEREFSTANHIIVVRDGRNEGEKSRNVAKKIKFEETVQDCPDLRRRILLCTKITGSCMTESGTIVTGTVILGMELCDYSKCDVC